MRPERILAIFFLCALLVAAFLIHFLDWAQLEQVLREVPYRCPIRSLTGFLCAFCGMTHSWIAIMKGDWERAFHENALGIPLFLAMVGISLMFVFKKDSHLFIRARTQMQISMIFLVVLIAYAFIRNCPLSVRLL